jgi:diaminohydroxyphosphoribosylaminopyrimidine deaminase/5-amino-6-(5-phosphoribosylamino)uracil reductase
MASAMSLLGSEGLTRIFCEGGGHLAAALLRADLADELAMFTAGMTLGSDARAGAGPMLLTHLSEARRFRCRESRLVGQDIFSHWDRP